MEEKRYNNMQTMTKDLYELRLTHDDFIEYAKGKAAEDFKDKTKEDLKNEFIKSIEYLKDNVRNKFTGKESLLSQAVYKSFPDESAKEILSNFAKNCRSYFKVYTKLKKVYLDEKRKDKTTELEKAHLEQKQKEKLDGINVKIIKIVNSMQEEKSDEVRNLVKECYTSFCGVLETERNNIKNDKNLKSPLSRILSDGKDATLSVGEKTIFEIAIFCGWDIKTANDMLGIIKHIGFHSKNVEHCLVHNCLMQMAKGIERTNALKKYLFYKYFYLIMFEEQSKVSTTKGETEADIKDTFFFFF